jgi:hypothetical protein
VADGSSGRPAGRPRSRVADARADQIRDDEEERRRCRSVIPVIAPDAFVSKPSEFVPPGGTPDTIAGWQAVADGFLTNESCAFHRNVEISARYAWVYQLLPTCFKWAGMAAIASHHVRRALFPLRLDTDRTGYVDFPRSLVRQKQRDPSSRRRPLRVGGNSGGIRPTGRRLGQRRVSTRCGLGGQSLRSSSRVIPHDRMTNTPMAPFCVKTPSAGRT